MLVGGGSTFANMFIDVLTLFAFVVWFWLLITFFADLCRREDIFGWPKALWVVGLIVAPYIGVLVYMISHGRGIAANNAARVQQVRDQLRAELGFSIADEIDKLDRLKKSGSFTQGEFVLFRSKFVA